LLVGPGHVGLHDRAAERERLERRQVLRTEEAQVHERVRATVKPHQLIGLDEAEEAQPVQNPEVPGDPADVLEVALVGADQDERVLGQKRKGPQQRGVVLVRPELRRIKQVRRRQLGPVARIGVGGSPAGELRGGVRKDENTLPAHAEVAHELLAARVVGDDDPRRPRDVAGVEDVPELPLAVGGHLRKPRLLEVLEVPDGEHKRQPAAVLRRRGPEPHQVDALARKGTLEPGPATHGPDAERTLLGLSREADEPPRSERPPACRHPYRSWAGIAA
jgi:hypothetical protein